MLAYGLKMVNPTVQATRPHILGFETARDTDDSLLEVWNDDTGTATPFAVFPNKIESEVPIQPTTDGNRNLGTAALRWGTLYVADIDAGGNLTVAGTLTGGAHPLVSASHTATGLTTGQSLRATSATAFGFGALDLANADAVTGLLPHANLANLAGLSLFGRSADSAGVMAAVTAGSDHQTLRRSGSSIGFGALNIGEAAAVTGLLPLANLSNLAGLSVLGRGADSSGVQAAITAGTDHQVLRRAGSALAFGQINLAEASAVVNRLAKANQHAETAYRDATNSFTSPQAIGTASAPHAAALLDLVSTERGILFPRMTTTQRNAISSPPAGLVIYNTTANRHQGYNGTNWLAFEPDGGGGGGGATELDELSDVSLGAIVGGEFLYFDGASWVEHYIEQSDIPNLPASKITSGTFANAQIAAGNVTQHQGALSIAGSQLTGTIADARLSANVPLLDAAKNTFTGDMQIDGDLDVGGDVTAFFTSDRRLKENITRIDGALTRIQYISGVSHDWLPSAPAQLQRRGRSFGVIAQDVEAEFPELVRMNGSDGRLQVDYNGLIAVLIEAVKDLREIVLGD